MTLVFLSGFEHALYTYLPLLAWNPRGTKAFHDSTRVLSPVSTWALQKCPGHCPFCLLAITPSIPGPKGPEVALPPGSHPQELDLQRASLVQAHSPETPGGPLAAAFPDPLESGARLARGSPPPALAVGPVGVLDVTGFRPSPVDLPWGLKLVPWVAGPASLLPWMLALCLPGWGPGEDGPG